MVLAVAAAGTALTAVGFASVAGASPRCDGRSLCEASTPYDWHRSHEEPALGGVCLHESARGTLHYRYGDITLLGASHRRYDSIRFEPGPVSVSVTRSCSDSTPASLTRVAVHQEWARSDAELEQATEGPSDDAGDPLTQVDRWPYVDVAPGGGRPVSVATVKGSGGGLPVEAGWANRRGTGSRPCVSGRVGFTYERRGTVTGSTEQLTVCAGR